MLYTIPVDIQKELDVITENIVNMIPDAQVILFGSYARGEQRKWSDLDICIVMPSIPYDTIKLITEVRTNIYPLTHLPLDIIIYNKSEYEINALKKSRLEYVIEKEGVKLNDR
jgi:predicted nucleotidyltransferase